VSRFVDHAREILEAAESATARGETCSDLTILIGRDGAIRMFADSDWPLDSLAWYHGAQAGYRVSERRGSVRVEGREGLRTCTMQSVTPAESARRLLASAKLF
jgi:hypothetical protein